MTWHRINRYPENLAVDFFETIESLLIGGNLLTANGSPIAGIKGQRNTLTPAIPRKVQFPFVVSGKCKVRSKISDLKCDRTLIQWFIYPI